MTTNMYVLITITTIIMNSLRVFLLKRGIELRFSLIPLVPKDVMQEFFIKHFLQKGNWSTIVMMIVNQNNFIRNAPK